jgi:hypothetical protein
VIEEGLLRMNHLIKATSEMSEAKKGAQGRDGLRKLSTKAAATEQGSSSFGGLEIRKLPQL